MPTPSNNAVASSTNGALLPTVVTLGPNDQEARVVVDGSSPVGVTGTIDVSIDGTTWFNIKAVQEDTSAPVSGTISPGSSKLTYWTRVRGFNYVRWNSTAVASGTSTVTVYAAPSLGGPPITVTADSTTAFTSGTFSGTLAVTGASTLTGAVSCGGTLGAAGATTLSSTLAVTGASTLTGAVTTGAAIVPAVNDNGALGDATHGFSDLFMASGAVVNINNGNWVATHTAGILTVGTGDLRVTTAGTNAASAVTVGGTQTLTNKTLTSPTFTAPVLGVATGTSLAVTGLLTSSSPTAGIGYATGAGGTVTQGTNRTTGVTLNTASGNIVLVSAAGQSAKQSFTVTNSAVAAGDTIILNQKSGTDKYDTLCVTAVAAGSFQITFANSSGTTTEQPVFNFNVIKGVAA